MDRISVLIPAYNEETAIGDTIEAVVSCPGVAEVIVVDDGSIDATGLEAGRAGATVIRLEQNLGKGAALNRGAGYVTGDIIALLDADLGRSAREMIKLVGPVAEGRADLTIGVFPSPRKKGGFGLVKGLAGWGVSRCTGLRLTAPLSGQRVMTRSVLGAVTPFAAGFGVEVAATITALRQGFRVLEIETGMSHKETGRDWRGFCHRGRQFCHIGAVILKEWR